MDVRIQAIGVQNAGAINTTYAMEMAGRAGGASYVIGRVMNNVTRSRYGKRLPQNRTSDVSQARSLVHAAGGF